LRRQCVTRIPPRSCAYYLLPPCLTGRVWPWRCQPVRRRRPSRLAPLVLLVPAWPPSAAGGFSDSDGSGLDSLFRRPRVTGAAAPRRASCTGLAGLFSRYPALGCGHVRSLASVTASINLLSVGVECIKPTSVAAFLACPAESAKFSLFIGGAAA